MLTFKNHLSLKKWRKLKINNDFYQICSKLGNQQISHYDDKKPRYGQSQGRS